MHWTDSVFVWTLSGLHLHPYSRARTIRWRH